jgi:hypothetical protein
VTGYDTVDGRFMDYCSYCPELVPHGFRLLEPFKKDLNGKLFESEADMMQAVTSWLQAVDTIACIGIQGLVSPW